MHLIEIDEKLDPDQDLPVTVVDSYGADLTIYLRYHDFLKIKKAFEEYKDHD